MVHICVGKHWASCEGYYAKVNKAHRVRLLIVAIIITNEIILNNTSGPDLINCKPLKRGLRLLIKGSFTCE